MISANGAHMDPEKADSQLGSGRPTLRANKRRRNSFAVHRVAEGILSADGDHRVSAGLHRRQRRREVRHPNESPFDHGRTIQERNPRTLWPLASEVADPG
jgi:hypothetical protein